MLGAIVWMGQCHVSLSNRDNWTKTTGTMGVSGVLRSKGSSTATVFYVDVATKEEVSGNMALPDDVVRAAVDKGSSDRENAYYTDNIFGKRTVCLESWWESCLGEAQPKWYMYLLAIILIVAPLATLIKEHRQRAAGQGPPPR